ncbi:SDR family oxidoreductase [Oceanospirillaceae bacterium]|jgi:NAD(P)-dependent dehydrogenase (short-subunit alcohol dehydrogenase family)|uniref:SDR family NAD(P)-dependent oxidoreductase n=1 Tax=Candidatus Njordibacter sp. Uisw_002 TaxID=3230971 RepID=UPI0023693173|nr:SDR family oxidoreductase [Oceanospirillaceae bacterium]MDC1340565.1 SDR family oxidoreductase [Oceanospirillaceae bacterium]MDC1509847.1 SDR family oxidoreductase [Oceanospirillaceae bacterium]|tara:strand:+ start:297 stop:1064 length:768 start_codon:yes stop_codon:yes gene_type:complete
MELTATYPDLMDKSVFITGGGAGIGAFLTEGFLAQGAKVSFVQRSNASEFVAQMKAKYKNAPLAITCDITDIDALQAAMDKAAAAHGVINVVVNNAGDDTRHSLAQTSVQAWDLCQNINLRPHFFTAQKAAQGMAESGGSIINVSSVSYMMGNAGYPGYVAANAGINGLTRALARELGPQNIRVNSLMPGWVMTDKQLKMWATPESMSQHLEKQCLKTHLKPEDIVGATLFLASSASRMMTGQAMVVDGGVVVTG